MPPRPGLSPFHPAALLSTWFGAGLLPKAPGTWGSAAALPFAWAISAAWGGWGLAAASVACFLVGWAAAEVYGRRTGAVDPGEVVIDEVAGQWLALSTAPLDPVFFLGGFALFRLFDIRKPWPVCWADRSLPGGLGVMADDMLAGAYAMLVLLLIAPR